MIEMDFSSFYFYLDLSLSKKRNVHVFAGRSALSNSSLHMPPTGSLPISLCLDASSILLQSYKGGHATEICPDCSRANNGIHYGTVMCLQCSCINLLASIFLIVSPFIQGLIHKFEHVSFLEAGGQITRRELKPENLKKI